MLMPWAVRRVCTIKSMSLVVLAIQTTTMVLLLRYSRTIAPASSAPMLSLHRTNTTNTDHRNEFVHMGSSHDAGSGGQHYVISTAVCLAEVLKLMLSLVILHIQSGLRLAATCSELQREVVGSVTETCKMVVPAALYLLQNNLLFIALTNLDAATYQVTYQLRILCTALFSWLLLGRRLSITHWMALACLMVGVALVQVDSGSGPVSRVNGSHSSDDGFRAGRAGVGGPLQLHRLDGSSFAGLNKQQQTGEAAAAAAGVGGKVEAAAIGDGVGVAAVAGGLPGADAVAIGVATAASLVGGGVDHDRAVNEVLGLASANHEVSWLLGLLAVFVSCVLSGFSGVYFERIVKRSRQTSLIIRNIQLGMFSLFFGAMSIGSDSKQLWEGGFFQGYTWATWAVIALQACGGLMVSVTMKYADNILKVFATSVSIVLSTLLSTTVLGYSAPSGPFVAGTCIVLGASVMYGLASPPQSTVSSTQRHQGSSADCQRKVTSGETRSPSLATAATLPDTKVRPEAKIK